MNLLINITALGLLAGLQARLPTFWWLGGVRLELLPALVAYGALTFRYRRWVFALTLGAGLLQDALSAAPFGNAIAGYTVAALALTLVSRWFDREALWMQMAAGAVTSVAVSLGACVVVGITGSAVWKVLLLAAMSAVVAPLLFLTLDGLRWVARPA